MKNTIILLLSLVQLTQLTAQQPMVAYRDTLGAWHYFDTNGKLMWQPYLDVASDPSGWANGLLRARVMDVVTNPDGTPDFEHTQVLYNNKGEIVFRPKADFRCRITAGMDAAGLVQAENYDRATLCLFNRKGDLVFEAPNTRAGYLNDGVVYYAKNNDEDSTSYRETVFVVKDVLKNKVLKEVKCSYIYGSFENDVVIIAYESGGNTILTRQGTIPLGEKPYEFFYSFADENPVPKGFVVLRPAPNASWALYNKKGQQLIAAMGEPMETRGNMFHVANDNDEAPALWYELTQDKATVLKSMSENAISKPTLDNVFACTFDLNISEVVLADKNGKMITHVPTSYWECFVFDHHIWVKIEEGSYDCYNSQGKKTGHVDADDVKIGKYGFVVFKQGELCGLAKEDGKILIQPQFDFGDNIPELRPGFLEVTTPVNDEVLFEYYNFEGKKVLSTLATKDNWDYLLLQETEYSYYVEH